MSRAYIRLDPGFDEHKHDYPDGAYAALVATFCLAESQAQRGRFRDLSYLKALLGKRGRWLKYLVEHQDVVVLPNGRVYVEGWDEWQEGDWKVGERVGRIRRRLKPPRTVTRTVTGVTADVTVENVTLQNLALSSAGGGADKAVLPPPAADSFHDRMTTAGVKPAIVGKAS
jgi:hypothetical protein